ncbi:hypothetical protein AAG570_012126 [Ranatra chinensis]|uniref:Uncharacterized protein n=1 Tax=Ranatra chinensis TaxID=642074 RepID=A0ABD0YI45_9HEMI
MDFDSLFVRLQGALMGAEKMISTSFSQLDKDFADEVKEVIKAISDVLDNPKEQVEDCRRVHLLIILNTDFSTVPLIEADDNYCHLLNTLPQFSTYLYFKVMGHFQWFDFLGEVIVHCPEALSLDVLKCIDAHMKELEVCHLSSFLYTLYSSLFDKVSRLQKSESLNRKHKFVKVFQNFSAFSISDVLQSTDWKMTVRHQFMGKIIRMFLLLLKACISRYKEGSLSYQQDIYNIMIVFDYSKWECTKHEIDWVGHCLNVLMSKCKKLAMDISVDMYMSWCELDIEENKTLQTAIRETAYSCAEALSELNVEDFPDLPMLSSTLQNIALKPKSEDDEINCADIEAIIVNLKNPKKNQEKWFFAFLNSPKLFSNSVYVSIIEDHLSLFNMEHIILLISKFIYYVQSNSNDKEYVSRIKNILSESIKQLPLINQVPLLTEFYEKHGNTSLMKDEGFENNLTEILNKIVDNAEKKEESGNEVIKRLLESSLNSKEKCNITLSLFTDLVPLSTLRIGENDQTRVSTFVAIQMLKSAEKLLPHEKDNYIYLPFIDGSAGCDVILKPVVLLAFLIQVLNKCRYKPNIFIPHSAQACENCITLIHLMVDKMLAKKTSIDSEILWLRNMASSCSSFTWYHVRKLWTLWNDPLPNDDYGIMRWFEPNLGQKDFSNITSEERATLVTSICKILPMLTTCEWKILGGSKNSKVDIKESDLFHILADGVLVLSQVPIMVKNLSCLSQVVSNFLSFIKFRTVPAIENELVGDPIAVFEKLAIITTEIPAEIVKCIFVIFCDAGQLSSLGGLNFEKSDSN